MTKINNCIKTMLDPYETLKNSTMFHMSLGSKELFHSNFLVWLSVINWDAFLFVMKQLADLGTDTQFWWEKDYNPKKENIEVRREYHNFDLSIYVCLNKDKVDEKEVWLPVLLLENKMKSLPYQQQLEDYVDKIFDEWAPIVKNHIKNPKKQERCVSNNENYSITFILLSLLEYNLGSPVINKSKEWKKPKFKLELQSNWVFKTYENLINSFESIQDKITPDNGLNRLVFNDYCVFVTAMHKIAKKYWTITSDMKYSEICKLDDLCKKLRIHDIREKIHYDQMLNMLEKAFKENNINFERFNKKKYLAQYKDGTKVFTKSDFTNGIGLFEVRYVLEVNDNKELSLMIQVQGDSYRHMVIKEGIVKKENNKSYIVNTQKVDSKWHSLLYDFIEIDGSLFKPSFLFKGPELGKYNKFDDDIIYQSVKIPDNDNITIAGVIGAIVNEIIQLKERII